MGHPLEAVAEVYLENIDVRPKTAKRYRWMLGGYIEFLKEKGIMYARRDDVLAYKKHLETRPIKTSTVRGYLSAVRNLYRWLKRYHAYFGFDPRYDHDVAEGIKPSEPLRRSRRSPLFLPQVKRLLAVARSRRSTIAGVRNHAMVLLMVTAGLRVIEIRRARIRDMRVMEGHTVLDVRGKGKDGHGAFVKPAAPVIEAIETYLAMRDDDDPHLFITHKGTPRGLSHGAIASAMKTLFCEARICSTDHPLHALRHTCAALNLKTGGSLEETRRLLRHASTETTMIYLRGISRWDDDSERKVAELIFGHGQE